MVLLINERRQMNFFFFLNFIVKGAGVELWMSSLETRKSLNQLS